MAIINNNVQNVKFLRNGSVYNNHDAAYNALTGFTLTAEQDGTAILARYTASDNNVKTLVGWVYSGASGSYITIQDVEGASSDIAALLGGGVTTANTVTMQLTALSGDSTDTSATTSVAGAKKYTDVKIAETIDGLDVAAISAPDGAFIKSVSQSDGKVSATTEYMPTVSAISAEGQAITAVSQSNGTVSATAGDIAATHVTVADSGDLFTATTVEGALAEIAAEIDAMDKSASAVDGQVVTTVSEVDGVVSETKANVKDLTLGGYAKTNDTGNIASGDTVNVALSKLENKTAAITIANADGSINVTTGAAGTDINVNIKSGEKVLAKDGDAGIYTDIKLSAVTPSSTAVKEEYSLVATDGSVLGTNIKIYKDSHIVSITYITDPADAHYQNLEYVYIDASGDTQTEYVDISSLVLEAEFASGVTITNHVAHGVVDPTSESFLTVGADGFKLSGVQNAIDTAVSGLDATVSAETAHVSVQVDEVDGKLTAVTLTEDNIANADDLTELSGKTVTAITSTNGSISALIDDVVGNKTYNIETDASKIKMSGFTGDGSLSGITTSDSIAGAFGKVEGVIDGIDGRLDIIEPIYLSGVSVNGSATTFTDHVAGFNITSSTGATTAATSNAIVVDTDANGNITLGLNYIDAGIYDTE